MKSFGEIIKEARESKGHILRTVSSQMNIDQALICKYEKGIRKPSKEQVFRFAKFYELDEKELLVAWLSDKVVYEIIDENNAEEVLKVAEKKIQYLKSISYE